MKAHYLIAVILIYLLPVLFNARQFLIAFIFLPSSLACCNLPGLLVADSIIPLEDVGRRHTGDEPYNLVFAPPHIGIVQFTTSILWFLCENLNQSEPMIMERFRYLAEIRGEPAHVDICELSHRD